MKSIGLIGLGAIGRNLALNFARHGVNVVGFDRDSGMRQKFQTVKAGTVVENVASLVERLRRPRLIVLLVPAGPAVDEQLALLLPLLATGDVIVDAGNSHFRDTDRREVAAKKFGASFVGMGLSGGTEGARLGPSLMAGGEPAAVAHVRAAFAPLAAQVGGEPCFAHFGGGGAGHFVKTIHNGIEYADMQMIAEGYFLLRHTAGLSPADIGETFLRWNEGPLASYLMEITAKILLTTDAETGGPLVDVIVDSAEQKGTGYWAATAAMELGVPAPTIVAAVQARSLSALRDDRLRMSAGRLVPTGGQKLRSIDAVRDALMAGKICAYAQGFAVLAAAREAYGWSLDPAEAARVWRGGCIIRARLLDDIRATFAGTPGVSNLLACPNLHTRVTSAQTGWREVVCAATAAGLPAPALGSALAYWDSVNTPRLWADLLQAQRDFFGAHGFHRLDRDGVHHGPWVGPEGAAS